MTKSFMPGLKDLARETGLSVSTVSRSIRGIGEISAETRERINAAAKKLGYVSNLSVHAMMSGRTKTIGVMLNVSDRFYSEIFRGAGAALFKAGYATLLAVPSGIAEQGPPYEPEILQMMLERRVDGLLLRPLASDAGDSYFSQLLERGMPIVHVDSFLEGFSAPFAGTDDYEGARLATTHLIEAGHKLIGHIPGNLEISSGRDRRRGFEDAVKAAKGVSMAVSKESGFSSKMSSAAFAMLSAKPRPTAIFAANDSIAVGVYRAASKLGLRIPEDLSVIGFGDLDCCELLDPELTTMRQFPRRIGELAATQLLQMIDGSPDAPKAHDRALIMPELVSRSSVRRLS